MHAARDADEYHCLLHAGHDVAQVFVGNELSAWCEDCSQYCYYLLLLVACMVSTAGTYWHVNATSLLCTCLLLCSYGDKTCLRTLTPGQGARARCGIKCMLLLEC
jgi:hypothetical protein